MNPKKYIRKEPCAHCGEPHWFRYWVGEHCATPSSGLAVGDFDLTFHKFKNTKDNLGERRVEHIMVVEIKTGCESLGPAQRDTLSVFNGALNEMVPVNGNPIAVHSRPGFIRKGHKKIVWHGVHLLRVPKELASGCQFFWDNHKIEADVLAEVLEFYRDPNQPDRFLDIDRRHKRAPGFFGLSIMP